MKRKFAAISAVVVALLFLLPLAATSLSDAGVVRAQSNSADKALNLAELPLPPQFTLTLTPFNPPIILPASGGTFQFAIVVDSMQQASARFDVWTSMMLPDGGMMEAAQGPFRASLPGNWTLSRDDLTQEIQADDPPGVYTYNAHVGRFPDRIVATESFTFEKLVSGGWYAQSSGTSDWIFDIHFADSANGWAVGQTNTIVHTSNGGDIWAAQSTPIFTNLWTVFAVDAQRAWAGGSGGVILHTDDAGATWVQQDAGGSAANAWEGLYFLDASNGWIVGGKPTDFTAARRVIKHTTDGGLTWETQHSMSNDTPLNAVHFVDAHNGWAVGDGSGILHTSNGGATWTEQSTGAPDFFEDVVFTDVNNGWVVGRDGVIAHTTDGGATWSVDNLGSEYDLIGIDFSDGLNGWISGSNQTVSQAVMFHTDDGGASWHSQDPSSAAILYSVVFVDPFTGWAAGDNGTIIHTETGGE